MYGEKAGMKFVDVLFEFFNSFDSRNEYVKYMLGVFYHYGVGTKVDIDKALTYYREAVEANVLDAYFDLLDLLKKIIQYGQEQLQDKFVDSLKKDEIRKDLLRFKKEYSKLYEELENDVYDVRKYELDTE